MAITDLYLLQKKDLKKAANVLTRAFHNDPLICLIYPNDEERIKYSPSLWEFLSLDGIRSGEVYSPSENIEGIAKWLPPGKEHRLQTCSSYSYWFTILPTYRRILGFNL